MEIRAKCTRPWVTLKLLIWSVALTRAFTPPTRECQFHLVRKGFRPSAQPEASLRDVRSLSYCAHACLSRLGPLCQSLGYVKDQRECRLYSVFNASDVTVVSPGLKFYRGCRVAESCRQHLEEGGDSSGVYWLQLQDWGPPFPLYCDMDTEGGGWMVFQRRQDGSEDFYRDWADYRQGFGELEGEHWLGNALLHRLTSAAAASGGGTLELRVELRAWEHVWAFARYSSFSVGDEASNFRLAVSGYSGTAGDALSANNGYQFTTFDRDNDIHQNANCADWWHGGWWYKWCGASNPNGRYGTQGQSGFQFAYWNNFRNTDSLKSIEMKLR